MCTAIGHSLAGYSIICMGRSNVRADHSVGTNSDHRISFLSLLMYSNLPDIDYLFGVVKNNPNLYHHLWTHSISFGVLAGLGYLLFRKSAGLWTGLIVSCLVFSHLLLDYFTLDTSPPFGIQLYWPFSKTYFISSVSIFRDVSKAPVNDHFIQSLFCLHNLYTVLLELGLLGPIAAVFLFFQKMKYRKLQTKSRP